MNPLIPDHPSSPAEAAGEDPSRAYASQERRWYYHAFRQAWGRAGSTYGLSRTAGSNTWRLECILPNNTKRALALLDNYEEALRVMDYCAHRDTAIKLALVELYENANPDPLEKLINDGRVFGDLPRRRMRVTLQLDVEMRGTDEQIKSYVELHCRSGLSVKAARTVNLEGPRLEEPRPLRSDEAVDDGY